MGSRHFVIIGNGISGITFARHLRKGDDQARITVISGESPYFFSRTALMYVYMGQMKWEHTQPYEPYFWKKNRIDLKQAWVKSITFESKTLVFESGETLNYDSLVLATGSKPAFFGWPGQDLKGVQGLYTKHDLETMEAITSQPIQGAVIVGGGLIGIELAEMLTYKKIPVTYLVRESRFWEQILPEKEANLVQKHILDHEIDLRFQTEIPVECMGRLWLIIFATNRLPINLGFGSILQSSLPSNTKPMVWSLQSQLKKRKISIGNIQMGKFPFACPLIKKGKF